MISGTIYHHAYTQTPQKPEKLPAEKKSCRDTQTAEEKEKIYVSKQDQVMTFTTKS